MSENSLEKKELWAEVKACVRACFHIDRGVKHLLHDVRVGFEGGKCALTEHVCVRKSGEFFDLPNSGVKNFTDLSLTLLTFTGLTTLMILTRSTLTPDTKCWTSTFTKLWCCTCNLCEKVFHGR